MARSSMVSMYALGVILVGLLMRCLNLPTTQSPDGSSLTTDVFRRVAGLHSPDRMLKRPYDRHGLGGALLPFHMGICRLGSFCGFVVGISGRDWASSVASAVVACMVLASLRRAPSPTMCEIRSSLTVVVAAPPRSWHMQISLRASLRSHYTFLWSTAQVELHI